MKKRILFLVFITFLSFQFVNAQVAINTDGSAAASGAVLHVKGSNGNHFYVDDLSGNVGIGTLTPGELLHVAGPVQIGAYVLPATDGSNGQVLTTDGLGAVSWTTVSGGGTADGDAWGVSGEDQTSSIGRTGFVGVGVNTPSAQLHVGGHIWVTGTGQGVFVGENAGANDNLNDLGNVYVGYGAGMSNVSSSGNVGVGYGALQVNTAETNTALGSAALTANTSGNSNTAVGSWAMVANTLGSYNVAVGEFTMSLYREAQDNTAIGFNALQGTLDLQPYPFPEGNRHVAVGYESISQVSDAQQCTGVGYKSLYDVRDGSWNTGVGYNALKNVTNGTFNTSIGHDAYPLGDYTNTTAIGAGAHPSASNQMILGNTSVTQVKTSGGVTVGNTSVTEAGTIRWNGTHFEGYNGSSWVQLDN